MFLKKSANKKTGKTYLSIVHGYRDQDGKSKTHTVKSLGYLDELEKEYDDPISHFEKVALEMQKEKSAETRVSITIDTDKRINSDSNNKKNYGHIIPSLIYHELEIDRFLDNKRRHANYRYNIEQIARLLIFSRILYPKSKRGTFSNVKELYFDGFHFTIDDIYESLAVFHELMEELQQHVHQKIVEQYKRHTSLIYYNVTNYYFEIDKEDKDRKRGPSKEKRHDPIIQMGLAVDNLGIPISYQLFEGNTHDSETYLPYMAKIKKKYGAKRIVVVADKGLNSGDNIAFNLALGDGYIFSQKIRGGSQELRDWILDPKGYSEGKDYKRKSRVLPVTIHVTDKMVGNKKHKTDVRIDQKQIVFYSEDYAKRARHKRQELLDKAADLIKTPSKYTRATHYGAANYVKNVKFNAKTGEIVTPKERLSIDNEKVEEEKKYDGYYLIVTSELDVPDDQIVDHYHGLWQIEESFKITKSTLNARPVFLRKFEHINAHFLTCFLALLILRLIEVRIGSRFRAARIVESLRRVECTYLEQNYYIFGYRDEVIELLEKTFNVDMSKKYMTLSEIKNSLVAAKAAGKEKPKPSGRKRNRKKKEERQLSEL